MRLVYGTRASRRCVRAAKVEQYGRAIRQLVRAELELPLESE